MSVAAAPIFRSATALKRHVEALHAQGASPSVVLANGCFDPLHVGHVRYLSGAKQHGDYLVVAVNNDASVRRLKGAGRPILRESDRAKLLANLDMVDAVLIFGGRDAVHVLKTLRPDFHANGTDFTIATVPELETSKSLGVTTVIVGDDKNHASSDVVSRIRHARGGS